MSAGREELRERVEKWAREMALEAVTQGFQAGWDQGHKDTVQHGQGANPLSEKGVRQNEAPFVPIIGSEMDGFPEDVLALLSSGERAEPVAWPEGRCAGCGDDVKADHGALGHTRTGVDENGEPFPMSCGPVHPFVEPVGRAPESEGVEQRAVNVLCEIVADDLLYTPEAPRTQIQDVLDWLDGLGYHGATDVPTWTDPHGPMAIEGLRSRAGEGR